MFAKCVCLIITCNKTWIHCRRKCQRHSGLLVDNIQECHHFIRNGSGTKLAINAFRMNAIVVVKFYICDWHNPVYIKHFYLLPPRSLKCCIIYWKPCVFITKLRTSQVLNVHLCAYLQYIMRLTLRWCNWCNATVLNLWNHQWSTAICLMVCKQGLTFI